LPKNKNNEVKKEKIIEKIMQKHKKSNQFNCS